MVPILAVYLAHEVQESKFLKGALMARILGHTLNAEILVGSCSCLTGFPAELFPEMYFTGLRILENTEDVRNTCSNPKLALLLPLKKHYSY